MSLALPSTLPDNRPWPRISIVTPSFNQGRYIEETIRSVLEQNYPNLEYIVIDGGSTDASVDIIKRYADRLSFWTSERDRGQSHALNKGFARATGEIMGWVNSDDRLAPGALAAMAMAFHHSRADMVAGLCTIFHERGPLLQHMTAVRPGPLRLEELLEQERLWNRGRFFYQPEVMFSQALWQRSGAHIAEHLHYVMDYELWCRFAAAEATIDVIGRPIAEQRMHAEQKTHSVHSGGVPDPAFTAELQAVAKEYRERYGIDVPAPYRPAGRRGGARILAVNDIGFSRGAGVAHRRLIEALTVAGHEIEVLSMADESAMGLAETRREFPRLLKQVSKLTPDFIIAGNIHGATRSAHILADLSQRAPVAVVLHDLFLVTGRCAYPGPCKRAASGCDEQCPTPHEYPKLAPARITQAWQQKRDWFRSDKAPLLLANSSWTAEVARECLGPDAGSVLIDQIRLAFPVHIFRPGDRNAARRRLGIAEDAFVVAFADSSAEDPRKSIEDVRAALRLLGRKNVVVLAIGPIESHPDDLPGTVRTGYLAGDREVAAHLLAADVMVCASRAETFGQTAIEAPLCGVPVIAYRKTGLADAVEHGTTGLLIEPTVEALTEALRELMDAPDRRRDLGAWGRIFAESRYSHAASYHTLRTALVDAHIFDEDSLGASIGFSSGYALSWRGDDASLVNSGASPFTPDRVGTVFKMTRTVARLIWRRGMPTWAIRVAGLIRRMP